MLSLNNATKVSMEKTDCVFCKIIARQIPSSIVKETGNLIVIKDIAPKAPIHYLIIPKKHIKDIQSMDRTDAIYGSAIFSMAQELSKELQEPRDFRLVISSGYNAGQRVFHLHSHFLAGTTMAE
jgi:histidine triad (HIT) family protein